MEVFKKTRVGAALAGRTELGRAQLWARGGRGRQGPLQPPTRYSSARSSAQPSDQSQRLQHGGFHGRPPPASHSSEAPRAGRAGRERHKRPAERPRPPPEAGPVSYQQREAEEAPAREQVDRGRRHLRFRPRNNTAPGRGPLREAGGVASVAMSTAKQPRVAQRLASPSRRPMRGEGGAQGRELPAAARLLFSLGARARPQPWERGGAAGPVEAILGGRKVPGRAAGILSSSRPGLSRAPPRASVPRSLVCPSLVQPCHLYLPRTRPAPRVSCPSPSLTHQQSWAKLW